MSTSPLTFADFGIEIPSGARGEIDVLCPRCSHTRKKRRQKCLSVNVEKGVWQCMHSHCGWKGGLGSSAQAEQNGATAYGAPLRQSERPPGFTKPPLPAEQTVSPPVRRWFAKRGIAPAVLERARISSGREYCPQFERDTNAIRFPYFRAGELINVKYRANPKAFWMCRGAERILYGLDDIAGAETIVIVEGEMDKLSVDQAGGWPCVSVPDGAPAVEAANYGSKFDFLSGLAGERLAAAKTVIIATDMDAPGEKLADELARRIGYARCRRAQWPAGCKDANETLIAHGVQGVIDALGAAQPYAISGITTIHQLSEALDDLYDRGYDRGCDVDWPHFDEYCRTRHGLLTIATGSPGAGKSHLIDNIVTRLACRHGWTFAVCSPENQPLQRHAAALLSIYQGLPFTDGPTPRMSRAQMHEARDWAAQHFTFVLPDPPTLENILERAEVLAERTGICGLIIDPWNELSHNRPRGMSVTDFASEFLTTLRAFARRHQVHVWLVAHPTKLQKTNEGAYPVPTPYDVADSAHFYNKADTCLAVWRNVLQAEQPAQVHVQKIRFAETGKLGMIELAYDTPSGRFYEPGGSPNRARPAPAYQRALDPRLVSQQPDPWPPAE